MHAPEPEVSIQLLCSLRDMKRVIMSSCCLQLVDTCCASLCSAPPFKQLARGSGLRFRSVGTCMHAATGWACMNPGHNSYLEFLSLFCCTGASGRQLWQLDRLAQRQAAAAAKESSRGALEISVQPVAPVDTSLRFAFSPSPTNSSLCVLVGPVRGTANCNYGAGALAPSCPSGQRGTCNASKMLDAAPWRGRRKW